MTYIEKARELLVKELAGSMGDGPLMDLYLLLVLTRGEETTLEDVHDAWAIRKSRVRADHKYIVPFEELAIEVQNLDAAFLDAIVKVAQELKAG